MPVIELDIEIPDLASVEVETPDVEITPSSGETVLLVATPGPPGPPGDTGPAGDGAQVFGGALTGTQDGVNVTFTTPDDFRAASTAVYRNGLREIRGPHYTESAPNSIVFSTAPTSTDNLSVDYVIQ